MIANNVNGFLFNATRRDRIAPTIARLVAQHINCEKTKEAAHGQAFEVFSVRRYVDQHIQLYENVRAQTAAADGIVDPAFVS